MALFKTEKPQSKEEALWNGMPKIVNEGESSYHKLVVRFRNEEDLKDFVERIGQPTCTKKSISIWHPRRTETRVERSHAFVDGGNE